MAQKIPGTTTLYWGEGGQYGPFSIQQQGEWTGWPEFGQVMRYFRKKARLSAREFGILYGKEFNTDGSAVCERWIQRMELENDVPLDINKRKSIARLLKIPPMLFGLAVLEEVTLEPYVQAVETVKDTKLQRIASNIAVYKNNIRSIWQMHDTGSAQCAVEQVSTDIRDLQSFEQQSRGDLQYHVQEILVGNQLLMTHIIRDERRFKQAYLHANEAVRAARNMGDNDLIATALFTRGWTCLEWGLFGTMEHGMFQMQADKVSTAVWDFKAAKQLFPARDESECMHPQLLGCLTIYETRALATLALSRGERIQSALLLALDDTADTVDKQEINDGYMRALITGTRKGWHQAGYLTTRAAALTAAGLPGKALQDLNALEHLVEKNYRRDETRQFAWLDILKANIYMSLGEYKEATERAKRALLACQDINSVTNTAIVTDIYGRLLKTSYRTAIDVKELREILSRSSALMQSLFL